MQRGTLTVLTLVCLAAVARALRCRAYGNTFTQGLEPSHAELYCDATSYCGRMDAGNERYHEVMYFCDYMQLPKMACGGVGCTDVYRLPNITADWMLQLRLPTIATEYRNTSYFRLCCCNAADMCLPDPEVPTCVGHTPTAMTLLLLIVAIYFATNHARRCC
jgi:hypothetical protein